MRAAYILSRTAAQVAGRSLTTPLYAPRVTGSFPGVGCSYWVRSYATQPPAPLGHDATTTTTAETEAADDFFEDVEFDEVEWEGEEVSEGVFVSGPTTSEEIKTSGGQGGGARRGRPHSIKHLNRLLSRHQVPDLHESELDEKFVRGRGPGGQAINKTNSSVSLRHIPTGIVVQAQPTRSREQNRHVARQILKERLDLMRARGELADAADGEEQAMSISQPEGVSRKERLAAEARTWSKQELRWEKERRRKLNRKKKVNKRKKAAAETDDAEDDE